MTGTGRTVVKGSFSMYVGNEGVGPASSVNPMFLSRNRCVWTDTNGDLNAQPNELSNCAGFTGGVSTRLDPDLKRQFNREYTLGFQHELAPDLGLSVTFYRRENRNMRGPRNLAIPASSYIPVTVNKPADERTDDDFQSGSGDSRPTEQCDHERRHTQQRLQRDRVRRSAPVLFEGVPVSRLSLWKKAWNRFFSMTETPEVI